MRKAGFALALAACAQLTLLSSPAFADGTASASASVSASAPASSTSSTPSTSSDHKSKTGWVVLGIGAGVTIAGIVLDIVGTQQGHVAGTGGSGDADKTSNARTNFYWGGTALIVAGVVTGVIGGSMVWASGQTSARPADEEARADGATKAVQAAYQSAPSFTVPVLGATF
jgi:hypothetical protein